VINIEDRSTGLLFNRRDLYGHTDDEWMIAREMQMTNQLDGAVKAANPNPNPNPNPNAVKAALEAGEQSLTTATTALNAPGPSAVDIYKPASIRLSTSSDMMDEFEMLELQRKDNH